MKHFAKSILNYFATFNETRFRFGTKQLAYQWGDQDQHTLDVLDLAIFPEFQARILDSIAANQPVQIRIRAGDYAIRLPRQPLVNRLRDFIQADHGADALRKILADHDFFAAPQSPPTGSVPGDLFSLPVDRQQKWLSSCREFNLRLRKEYARGLLEVQQSKLNELKLKLGLENAFAPVSLAARQEE